MDSEERARRAELAKRIRTGVIAAGAAGALGLTGVVAAQAGSSAQTGGNAVNWTFADSGDSSSGSQDWQSDGGSWSVRPQDGSGSLSQPHAQSGGS